jgi:hypothetical protein
MPRGDVSTQTKWNRGHRVTSRAFSPALFAGEKVPKADEGAVLALKLTVFASFPSPFVEMVHSTARTNAPSSAFGTFSPPLKSAGGRRTLDEHHVIPVDPWRSGLGASTSCDPKK